MKYYSEETVQDIIKRVAHTVLAQSQIKNYTDAILQNKPHIEIKEPHGRLVDVDRIIDISNSNISYYRNDTIYVKMYEYIIQVLSESPTVLEASTSPSGFCNTEGCSNSKPDMSKAQNHICPYYQGVCSLDEDLICYCQHHYEMCDKFIEVSKEEK